MSGQVDGLGSTAADVVAERLKRERQRRGWSAADVVAALAAEGCRIRRPAIKDIEDRKQPIKFNEAVALSRALGVTLDDLLTPIETLDNREANDLLNDALASMARLYDAGTHLVGVLRRLATKSLGFEWDREISDYVQGNLEARANARPATDTADARLAVSFLADTIVRLSRASQQLGHAAWLARQRTPGAGVWVVQEDGVVYTHEAPPVDEEEPLREPGIILDDASMRTLASGALAPDRLDDRDGEIGYMNWD